MLSLTRRTTEWRFFTALPSISCAQAKAWKNGHKTECKSMQKKRKETGEVGLSRTDLSEWKHSMLECAGWAAPIEGQLNVDLWKAAGAVMSEARDGDHLYIELFHPNKNDSRALEYWCGS